MWNLLSQAQETPISSAANKIKEFLAGAKPLEGDTPVRVGSKIQDPALTNTSALSLRCEHNTYYLFMAHIYNFYKRS